MQWLSDAVTASERAIKLAQLVGVGETHKVYFEFRICLEKFICYTF